MNGTMGHLVYMQVFDACFLTISVLMIVSVAIIMYRNGRLVLADTFPASAALAKSVNQSLVIGFCLLMAGDFAVLDQSYLNLFDYWQVFHLLVDKVGSELIMTGSLYLVNIFLLSRIRQAAQGRIRQARNGESELA
jgi:hypothetical protein